MAWTIMFPDHNTGFAYDTYGNDVYPWTFPYPYYSSEPLGVYSSVPQVTVNNTWFATANAFSADKYGFGSPLENLTLRVDLYQVPENGTTNFWAFGYNPSMVSLTENSQPIETSYITITPNANSNTKCTFSVPSDEYETCGQSNPRFIYIPTNNTRDRYDQTAIYSTLDSNTGRMAWVYETGYNGSVLVISNNQVITKIANASVGWPGATPTGITFDSNNSIAYITYIVPGGGPSGLAAISGDHVVSTPISSNLQSSPVNVAYDPHYDYLYVSYSIQPMTPETDVGIGVFDPNNGAQLAYIPIGNGPPTEYAYDSANGDMFALVPFYGSNSTVYDVSGTSIVSSFSVSNETTSMTFNPADGYLYLAQQNGDIIVVNATNGYTISTIHSYSPSAQPNAVLVYDSSNQLTYAFESGELLVVSGTSVVAADPVQYNVTSALYVPQYNNVLAFH